MLYHEVGISSAPNIVRYSLSFGSVNSVHQSTFMYIYVL
jgi:hypothetical protein